MLYLDNTVLEMKERIMLVFHYLRNARTEKEAARHTEKLEELIQLFKNSIEIGRKLWTNKD